MSLLCRTLLLIKFYVTIVHPYDIQVDLLQELLEQELHHRHRLELLVLTLDKLAKLIVHLDSEQLVQLPKSTIAWDLHRPFLHLLGIS
jgi:hypothetical protein